MPKLSHREIAVECLKMAATGKVREMYNRYVSPDFRHHNAYFPGDRESLMKAQEENAANNPNMFLDVKLSLEDGDLVSTFSHVRMHPDDRGFALAHVFRFENDQIVEAWDINQPIPEDSPNENGVF